MLTDDELDELGSGPMINDETCYNEETLHKVYAGLLAAGIGQGQAIDVVNQILNEGILFRERRADLAVHAFNPVDLSDLGGLSRRVCGHGFPSSFTDGGSMCGLAVDDPIHASTDDHFNYGGDL